MEKKRSLNSGLNIIGIPLSNYFSINSFEDQFLNTSDCLEFISEPDTDFFFEFESELESKSTSKCGAISNNSYLSNTESYLPPKTHMLHNEIVKRINNGILFPIKPFEISYSNDIGSVEAIYDRRFPDVLQISKDLAFLIQDGIFEFKDGKILNSTPEDYFFKVITHEYGHRIFERDYFESLFDVYGNLPLNAASKEIHSIDEAFAYWFTDHILGIDSLYEETALAYEKRLNVNTLKSFYQLFKQEEIETDSIENIITNLSSIVMDNKNYIKKVTLPNYDEQLTKQLYLFDE